MNIHIILFEVGKATYQLPTNALSTPTAKFGFRVSNSKREKRVFCFLLGGDGVVGSCGAASDIDDVGTVGNQLFAMEQGIIHLVVSSAV